MTRQFQLVGLGCVPAQTARSKRCQQSCPDSQQQIQQWILQIVIL